MTVVVTDNCQLCRFTECVTVCPVACFRGDEQMLYIEPSTCIECGSCIPVCPVGAIFDEIDLPEDKLHWKAINAQRASDLPVVDMQQNPLPTAVARRAELGRG